MLSYKNKIVIPKGYSPEAPVSFIPETATFETAEDILLRMKVNNPVRDDIVAPFDPDDISYIAKNEKIPYITRITRGGKDFPTSTSWLRRLMRSLLNFWKKTF